MQLNGLNYTDFVGSNVTCRVLKKNFYSGLGETSVSPALFELTCCVEVTGQIADIPRPRAREAGGWLHKGLTSDDAVFPQYVLT